MLYKSKQAFQVSKHLFRKMGLNKAKPRYYLCFIIHLYPIFFMLKTLVFTAFFYCTALAVTAQTLEAFIEKLEAVDINDSKGRLAVLDQAIQAFPKNADLYGRRADLKTVMEKAFSKKDTYGFMADYDNAIKFDNVSWRYTTRANGKLLVEDYQGALADCNTAVAMAEKTGEKDAIFSAYFGRIVAKTSLKDYKGAIADTEVAAKNHSDTGSSFVASMLSSAANFAEEAGDFQLAVKYIDRAAVIYKQLNDDTESLMYYKRGEIQIDKLNNLKQGCADLKKALTINNGGIFKESITAKIAKHCK